MDELPLIEKYRPQTLDDIIGNKNQLHFLRKFIETGNVPNLLLNGEPGGGKTSAVLAFARTYLGDLFSTYCLELNASDERGIDVVRSKIRIFSQRMAVTQKYKIIILDESDNMTQTAQLALKRIMEQYEDSTRFFFTCNSIESIIPAIQSKCKIMFFGKIDKQDIVDRLNYICSKEKIKITEEAVDSVIELANNRVDIREMVNKLEMIKANFSEDCNIDKDKIYGICDKPSPYVVKELLVSLRNGELRDGIEMVNRLKDDGFTNNDVSLTLSTEIMKGDLDELKKHKLIFLISQHNVNFLEGNDSRLMMGNLLCEMFNVLKSDF